MPTLNMAVLNIQQSSVLKHMLGFYFEAFLLYFSIFQKEGTFKIIPNGWYSRQSASNCSSIKLEWNKQMIIVLNKVCSFCHSGMSSFELMSIDNIVNFVDVDTIFEPFTVLFQYSKERNC